MYVFYKCYNRWTDSVCGRQAYIAPSAVVLVYPKSVKTVDWVCSSIYWHLLATFLCNVLSVAFMSLEGSKIPKKVFKMSRGVSYYLILSGVPFSKHLPRLADIIGPE